MLDWFKKLMPKEQKFFDLFEAHAARAQEAARSLRAIVEGGGHGQSLPAPVPRGGGSRCDLLRGDAGYPPQLHHALRPL